MDNKTQGQLYFYWTEDNIKGHTREHWLTLSVGNTLDGPLEEGLARLAGGHAVVEARRDVAADEAHPLRAAVLVLQRVLKMEME